VPDRRLYLFQCGDTDRYALWGDVTGCNLPKDGHPWLLRADLEPEALRVISMAPPKKSCARATAS
jgi:hypothetical protein